MAPAWVSECFKNTSYPSSLGMKCFKNFTKFYHKNLIFSMLSFSNNLTSVSVYYELHDLFVSHHKASIKVIFDIDNHIYVLSKNNGLREVLPVFHCRSDGSASSLLNVNMKIPQSLRIEDMKNCLGRVWNEVSRNSLVNLCMLSYQSTTKVHNVHKGLHIKCVIQTTAMAPISLVCDLRLCHASTFTH